MQRPRIVTRPVEAYFGVRRAVTMRTLGAHADRIPGLIADLAAAGHPPTGAPFLRYLEIDMERELLVEAGVPVAEAGSRGGLPEDVRAGTLPAGRYASALFVGAPDSLLAAVAELLRWAEAEGLRWDREAAGSSERWGCRLEVYHTDPRVEPDPTRWETELLFRLAD
ncbi:MAG: GyrI-like domain-containing protein [Candidatus Dormibacteraceae bacterium]